LTGQDKESSRWVERPRNPVLEAVFLSKLMEKFGLTDAQSKALLTDARPATPPTKVAMSGGEEALDLAESFDRAWLRVGLALDRTNFTVDNRDRAKGIYYVRYADSMQELKREGLFGKLFYRKTAAQKEGHEYLVQVRSATDGQAQTQVSIVDADGNVDKSAEAQRILTLLHTQLN
jgi:outer membrane protein assembly factor BamC